MNMKLALRNIEKMIIHKILLPAMYEFYRKLPVDEQLVIFADAKNAKLPYSMIAMYDEMNRRGYHVENWCVNFDEFSIKKKLCYLRDFMKRYSQSKYVFICDYFLPVSSCRKKSETMVIQLWHATGMLKKFGFDAPDDLGKQKKLNGTKNIDLWLASSDMCVPIIMQATRVEKSVVQALGIPRTDIFFSEVYKNDCKEEFYNQYPECRNKKLILWAPTFRGNAKDGTLEGVDEILQLQKLGNEDYHVLIKVHPHLEKKYKINNCDITPEQLYPVIDLLITDYSSTLFDCYLCGKPFMIFAPDYETYMSGRGCYIDYEKDLGCNITKTLEELYTEVKRLLSIPDEFQNIYLDKQLEKCDGHATSRVADYVKKYQNV